MTKRQKTTWLIVLIIVLIIYFVFFFKKGKLSLTKTDNAGDIIYKQGSKYYLQSGTTKVIITKEEYDYLKASETSTSCLKPPAIVSNPNAKSTECFYNGYRGYINACGGCSLLRPIEIL